MTGSDIAVPHGTNIITDEEGRTYHLGVMAGEVANRIILMGDLGRAQRIGSLLSGARQVGTTHRGFYALTGEFEDSTVTVMSMGMGFPMMDMAVREIAQVTAGDLSIIRIGTCGTIDPNISVGTVAIADRSVFVRTDYNKYDANTELPFDISSRILNCSAGLTTMLKAELPHHISGTDVTCDSFYSSQGRHDPQFDDRNQRLIETLRARVPDASSVQMETYQLFHLADIIRGRAIHAAALAIVLAQRNSTDFLEPDRKRELEMICGLAALKAIVK